MSSSSRRSDFGGAVALVTGGASGIGRAVGHALVGHGADVWLADRDGTAAQAAASEAPGPGNARAVTLDVTDAEAVSRVVGDVYDAHGRLDLLFNNAGIALFGLAEDMTLAQWNAIVDVNVRGVIHGVHAAYPRMIAQGRGQIVNTASLAGLIPVPTNTAYAMSKHAVVGLSTSLRVEAARHGVRVNVVCPGVIETPIVERMTVLGPSRDQLVTDARKKIRLHPVDACARRILSGVARDEPIITVTTEAAIAWRLYRFVPSLMRRRLARMLAESPFARD